MKNSDEIVVGANGSIFAAHSTAPIPESIADPLGDEWSDLGLSTEDGVTWVDGKTLNSIRSWQSFYDVRKIVASKEGSLAFQLQQWNGPNLVFAFGGGEIVVDVEPVADPATPGAYTYLPPSPEEINHGRLGVEWVDGPHDFRLIFPKGMVTENVSTNIVRTAEARLPITFALLGEDGVPPFLLQTNHPAFAPEED